MSKTVPRWAQMIYDAAQWVDWRGSRFLTNITYWRYKFMDDHCSCEQCEKRRAEGRQGPLKKGLFR